jgi:hypothetical protein
VSAFAGMIIDELGAGPVPIDIMVAPNFLAPSVMEMKKPLSYFTIVTSNFRFSVSTEITLWSELDINC